MSIVNQDGAMIYYYNREVTGEDGQETLVKMYCDYETRREIEIKLRQRRSTLKNAIQAYMEEVIMHTVNEMGMKIWLPHQN